MNHNPSDESTFKDGVAIIGMACRFPGAKNLAEFWNNLQNGIESLTKFSDEELAASGIDTEMIDDPHYVKAGAILDNVEYFDADFFGISAADARMMDPQHRFFIECVWEALESSGYTPETFAGSIGIYAGSRISEYLLFNQSPPDLVGLSKGSTITNFQRLVGNDKDFLATRTSFKLNLKGPSLNIQTACSTSLVAVHLASESLLSGECDMALAGGISIRVPQKAGYLYSEGMIFSPDGHTRAFDANASGTHFSSGVGVVVLKRIQEALEDRDHIYAIIRGSAVNNDGALGKAGFTAPSIEGQAEVISQAMAIAGIEPASLSYIETHGTGTALGDLIEITALNQVFQEYSDKITFCAIGSVKTNIGHTVQAAGVAGLIKTALMLKHKRLVPSLNFNLPNPQLNLSNSSFCVNTKLTQWPSESNPRRAGVSSFGVGGTNAHVVLEEAPVHESLRTDISVERPMHILCLSAKTKKSLKALAGSYEKLMKNASPESLSDICYTANTGRTHFDHRFAFVAESTSQAGKSLKAFHSGEQSSSFYTGEPILDDRPKIAFLFTGQGSQYAGMGSQLYLTQPIFRQAIDHCNDFLKPYLEKPLSSLLFQSISESSLLDQTYYTQPVLFALEYALAQLWQSWGVSPDFVLGHSVGEYVAAYVSGAITFEDGLHLIAERGRIMQALPEKGEMAAVFATERKVEKTIEEYNRRVSIAAVNGPEHIVISGEPISVLKVIDHFEAERIKTRKLNVSRAFHSPLMDSVIEEFDKITSGINFNSPNITWISNLTGHIKKSAPDSQYWRNHTRKPIQFLKMMETLCEQNCHIILEIGPQPVLIGMAQRILPPGKGICLPSLRKEKDEWLQILTSLAQLYTNQININWAGFEKPYEDLRHRLPLPTYPFQRNRYWLETRVHQPSQLFSHQKTKYPLLGHRLQSPLKTIQYQFLLNEALIDFLKDHQLFHHIIFPAAAFVEMVYEAATEGLDIGFEAISVENLIFHKPLDLTTQPLKTLQIVLEPDEKGFANIQIHSATIENKKPAKWCLHTSGKILPNGKVNKPNKKKFHKFIKCLCDRELPIDSVYQRKRCRGLNHGPAFQSLQRAWRSKDHSTAIGYIYLPEQQLESYSDYLFHPALLDACFQICELCFDELEGEDGQTNLFLPFLIDKIKIYHRPIGPIWCVVSNPVEIRHEIRKTDLSLFDENGQVLTEISGLHFRHTSQEDMLNTLTPFDEDQWLYQIMWLDRPSSKKDTVTLKPSETILVFSSGNGIGLELCNEISDRGARYLLIRPGKRYRRLSKGLFEVNPKKLQTFKRLFKELSASDSWNGGRIIYLWGEKKYFDAENFNSSWRSEQALNCGGLLHIVQTLVEGEYLQQNHLYVITRGCQQIAGGLGPVFPNSATLWGLGRVLTNEHPEIHCTLIDLDSAGCEHELQILMDEISNGRLEHQLALRNNKMYAARLRPIRDRSSEPYPMQIPSAPYELDTTQRGILEKMKLKPQDRIPPGPGEVEILVRAAGLNFRDVLNALDKLEGVIGLECSGIITACGEEVRDFKVGDAVVAVNTENCFCSYINVDAKYVALKPKHLNFNRAAAIPIVYLTAYYCLFEVAKLDRAKRILIHAAGGGVGLAVIQLASRIGLKIYATANRRKWAYLKSLGVQYIFDSRSTDFAKEIMVQTNGEGVDIVINSLAGEFIPKSLSILGQGGTFIELGTTDVWNAEKVRLFRRDIQFFVFSLRKYLMKDLGAFRKIFQLLLQWFSDGELTPPPIRVFPIQLITQAFRTMANAQHFGKIVVSIQDQISGSGRAGAIDFDDQKSYLITGGFGELGMKVADWMVNLGAKHLILMGRNLPSEKVKAAINYLNERGAKLVTFQVDVSDKDKLAESLNAIRMSMPPLRGIIHAAGTFDDGLLIQHKWEQYESVMKPKIAGAWNLHSLTKDIPLEFFILFSSSAALLGGHGQGNYAAANIFLDALAHYRRSRGLTAVSINWGAWADIGMAASLDPLIQKQRLLRGWGQITPEKGLAFLKRIIEEDETNIAVLFVDWEKYLGQYAENSIPAFFSMLKYQKKSTVVSEGTNHAQMKIMEKLKSVTYDEARTILSEFLKMIVANVLGINKRDVLEDQQLLEIGLDSLSAVMLRNRILSELSIEIPIVNLFENLKITNLAKFIMKQLKTQDMEKSDSHIISNRSEALNENSKGKNS
jgi:myxalamid-type polyketide synthase MxaB